MREVYDSTRAVNKRHPYLRFDLSGRRPSLAVDARRLNNIPDNAFGSSPRAQALNAFCYIPQVVFAVLFSHARYGIDIKGNDITRCHVVGVGFNGCAASHPFVVGHALAKVEPDGATRIERSHALVVGL